MCCGFLRDSRDGAAVKFGGRLPELKQQMETANLSAFTASDLAFLGCVIGVFWIPVIP